ncbi:peptidyl-tRNA hydrolase [Coccidioides immitis RS]|uniref:peptidyl-tRNA hydrolase n=3 Tax=Coccidioides immitis TaxID=5501 RepID=J3KIY4_COCIM|nr:peptidyl-tRNA hydrolase [Coccidioides immitis RS]EAS35965.3 peptidyl-tRNA hydrolase [Coccidioides immitis RS]KMP01262.1 hypothetical protein CIRG_01402 [Coccidioides immitis RMSCC 2394]KMU75455.1 hypothetical protein CISG_05090 [Coccidioides immitis RMSCC 3703]TPX25851.1 aminoacyl-tRNA hydrolase [Coccidioides immitis]
MPPLFIASLGNPPPKYHKTLHSAGHIILRAVAEHLSANSFAPSPHLKGALATEAYLPRSQTRLTLWQSPTLMNISGPTMVRAYKSWLAREGADPVLPLAANTPGRKKNADHRPPLSLILVHDELELHPGELRIRRGGAELSARGHNGVKSVTQSLVEAGLLPASSSLTKARGKGAAGEDAALPPIVLRVGIGIGRPASRDPGTVADYVLREMRPTQYQETCNLAGRVVEMLEVEMARVQS